MNDQDKTREELLNELQELRLDHNSLKESLDKDISERKEAEDLLEILGSQAKIGTWEYDQQDLKFICSKEVLKIFEVADAIELNLDKVLKYYGDESSGIIHHAINLAIEQGKSFIRDSEIIAESGTHKWIRTQGRVIQKGKNKAKHVVGTIQDISEILLLELVTQESALTLNQVEQMTHIGHWAVNITDGSFYHSDEIKRIFGYEPSEYALSVEEAINSYHPDDREDVIRYFNRAAETGEGYEFDLRVIQPGGNIRYVHSKGYTDKNDDGKVTRVYGVFQDITERKQAEEEIIVSKEKAEESDRLKSAFLANMSHEIRTPMNGILGFAELLKDTDLKSDEHKKYLAIIETCGIRLLSIINDIISISKIEAGQMEISVSETNINEQIEFLYSFFKPEAEQKSLQLKIRNSLPSKEALIITDKEKVNAILTNLVKNALKFTSKGSIEFGYEKKHPYIEFFVKDSGIGIPKEKQQAVFERFIQGDISDKMAKQGVGLGLSISKAYVEKMGGKIWVESEIGKGSTFYFTISS